MFRKLLALAAFLGLLAAFPAGAACTAANPNANVGESTPSTAFTDNGDGTVTQNLTGLMWKRCAEGYTFSDNGTPGDMTDDTCMLTPPNVFSWSNALVQARNSAFAAHADWRLPNKKELESIVETCGYNPSINLDVFPNTYAGDFWSGSPDVQNPLAALPVNFYNGSDGYDNKTVFMGFVPPAKKGERLVTLPPSVSAKVLLLNELIAAGISNVELARRLGTRPQEVQRIVDLGHATKIDTIALALAAVGKRLDVMLAS
jgi:hypothetical protein